MWAICEPEKGKEKVSEDLQVLNNLEVGYKIYLLGQKGDLSSHETNYSTWDKSFVLYYVNCLSISPCTTGLQALCDPSYLLMYSPCSQLTNVPPSCP